MIIDFPKAGSLPSQPARRSIAARPVAASLQRRGTFSARYAPNVSAQNGGETLCRLCPTGCVNHSRSRGRAGHLFRGAS
jgi:hypothetical protein